MVYGIVLWPGAGHLYAGRFRHGVAWAVACYTLLLLVPIWFSLLWVALALKLLHVVDLGFVPLGRPPRSWGAVVILGLVVMAGFAFVLRATTMEAFKMPSSSMAPTFELGDHVFVE